VGVAFVVGRNPQEIDKYGMLIYKVGKSFFGREIIRTHEIVLHPFDMLVGYRKQTGMVLAEPYDEASRSFVRQCSI